MDLLIVAEVRYCIPSEQWENTSLIYYTPCTNEIIWNNIEFNRMNEKALFFHLAYVSAGGH